jgi:hypothetical protein
MAGAPSIFTVVGSLKFTFVPLIMSFTNSRGKNHGTHTELGYIDSVYDGIDVVVVVLAGMLLVVVVVTGGTEVVVVEVTIEVVVDCGRVVVIVVVAGATEVVVDVCRTVVVDAITEEVVLDEDETEVVDLDVVDDEGCRSV